MTEMTPRMFRFLNCALAFLSLPLTIGAETARADRLDCTGYPESRQFVDAQSWWKQTPGRTGSDYGHVHLGGCIPEREQHAATIELDVRLILHDNPGKVAEAVLVTKTSTTETTRIRDRSVAGFTCPIGTCERWLHWSVPLSWFDKSGLQEIRYRVYVDEPDRNRMISSLNFQTYINNGAKKSDVTRYPYLRGKGWYTGAGYCEASLRQPLPDTPVPSSYSPLVAMVDHGASGDRPVTHALALVDADFHNNVPGLLLREAFDAVGPVTIGVGQNTPTPKSNVPEPHKVFLRSDCDDPRGSTNSGSLVYTIQRQ
jgi:hypothetical protein